MLRRILFISLVALLLAVSLGYSYVGKKVQLSQVTVDDNSRQQILSATVRITLFAPLSDEQGDPQYVTADGQKAIQYVAGEGLGTLTRFGQDLVIVTHDHWTLLTPDLHKVQFHSVENELLIEMSGEAFQQAIRHRDGGTMVLEAADELVNALTAVPAGSSQDVGRQEVVYLAYRQPGSGQISVAAMLVKEVDRYQGQPAFRLVNLGGDSVVGGNSGGAVVVNGRLVGNMWTTTMEEMVSRTTGQVTSDRTQTNRSVAALLPLEV